MLLKFSFTAGKVSYSNKFLKTKQLIHANENGKISYREFATDPCRSLFRGISALYSDNANINITNIANKFIAMTEAPVAVEFDPSTLETLGVTEYDDSIPGNLTTAHPHYDFVKKEGVNYTTHISRESTYNIYRIKTGMKRELTASVKVKEPSWMHSFGLTEHYVILAEFPLVSPITPLNDLGAGKTFAESLMWRPEKQTKFTIIDSTSGKVIGSYESEPFFAFHHVNAFETENKVVVDIVAYHDDAIVHSMYLNVLRGDAPGSIPPSELRRYYITLDSGSVDYQVLYDHKLEFPRINYKKYNMKDYGFIYAAGLYASASSLHDHSNRLIKVNVLNTDSKVWEEKGCYPGEPVFIQKPGSSQEEDNGVVLSVVLDSDKGNSFLLALDARSFEEVARAEVPHHIPFGFHGNYFGDIK